MIPKADDEVLLGDALLREAALELLASSTISRYLREARRLACESGLASELRGNPELLARVRARVPKLLAEIERQSLRVPAEIEAAILLCVLAAVDSEDVLLRRASESSSPWVRALAMRASSHGTTGSNIARNARVDGFPCAP